MHLVVVESPAKAKTIERYLGGDYRVLASYGHVRDLPPKDGSVRPDEDFAMDWSVDDRGDKRIKEIARELGLLESTIKAHVKMILNKLNAANRTQAAMIAAALGLPAVALPRRSAN